MGWATARSGVLGIGYWLPALPGTDVQSLRTALRRLYGVMWFVVRFCGQKNHSVKRPSRLSKSVEVLEELISRQNYKSLDPQGI